MGSILGLSEHLLQSRSQRETLKLALDEAHSRYNKDHPLSKESHVKACEYMPGGNTRTVLHVSPFPLTIKTGESCYLTTVDGHKYIDFLGEYTAGVYGHNHPVIREAVEKALDGGWNYGGHSCMEQELAQTVCQRFPAMKKVRFVNSGTEANMMALATAVTFTRKRGILIFYGSYHGGTISGKVYPGKASINLPHEFVVGKYNDVQGTRALVESLKDDLAAILVEPMMGSGGCLPGRPEFLLLLRDLAHQYNIILIFDEVMTSRLAYHGLGFSHGIVPDLMTIGKWVGGGMTFGAFGGRDDLMGMYDPRTGIIDHPGTFNNNVFTMTAGIAGCKLFNEDKVRELNELGNNMRLALERIFQVYEIEGLLPEAPVYDDQHLPGWKTRPPKMYVTGIGSLMNVHFGGGERNMLQGLYYTHMLESGIYMAQRGFIALSIMIEQNHIDKFVEATEKFCQRMKPALKWEQQS